MKTLMDINNLTISKDVEIWIAKQPKNMNETEFFSSN